jgi:Kef-type K+ transport system membrane component KefB
MTRHLIINFQYFVTTGLRTNLGLLNTGISWAYIVIICLVAFTSKFVACGGVAYLNGYNWRESGAIGSLMSCKGYFIYFWLRLLLPPLI